MGIIKTFEKFLSERKPKEAPNFDKIHKNLKIGDWIEYYYDKWNYKTQKNEHVKEQGKITKKSDFYLISDFDVQVKQINSIDNKWIKSYLIIRKLEPEEIDAIKYNL
jgi:hypothetical protein